MNLESRVGGGLSSTISINTIGSWTIKPDVSWLNNLSMKAGNGNSNFG